MKTILMFLSVSLVLINCGGGSSPKIDKSAKELLDGKTFYEALCINNSQGEDKTLYSSYNFKKNKLTINYYSDENFSKKSSSKVYNITSYYDDGFNLSKKDSKYECSLSSLESNFIMVNCVNTSNKAKEIDTIDFNAYDNKKDALNNGSCN